VVFFVNPIKLDLKFNSKFTKTNGLVHYWPFNSHIQDVIGGAHLLNGSNASLTSDRYGRPLSALSLNNGMYKMPTRNYFLKTNFSLTCWVNLKMYNSWSKLVEFYDENPVSYISVILSSVPSFIPKISIRNGGLYSDSTQFWAKNKLTLNSWIHIGVTYEYPITCLYLNGSLEANATSFQIHYNKTRSFNSIGRNFDYPNNQDLVGSVDELKIFDRALTQKEVEFEMINDLY
jgi:hypothetical protein